MDALRIRKDLLGLTRREMVLLLNEFLPEPKKAGDPPPKGPTEQRLWEWEEDKRGIPQWALTGYAIIVIRAWEAERAAVAGEYAGEVKVVRLRETNVRFAALLDPALGELLALEPLMKEKGFLDDAAVGAKLRDLKMTIVAGVQKLYAVQLNNALIRVS